MIRVGIDVGGTFTDVVALDASTRRLIASVKYPTTHHAPQGVAAGIVAGLQALLRCENMRDRTVDYVAHSTTQATNALLEGDLAPIGLVGFGNMLARIQMRFGAMRIGSHARLRLHATYAPRLSAQAIADAVACFRSHAVTSVAIGGPFSVDDPSFELAFKQALSDAGFTVTCSSETSSQYGLRARLRTAMLNAAIIPTMATTATATAQAVRDAGIVLSPAVMRSDGGVMTLAEMAVRPIQTMLSGPAAGIAGALLFDRVREGIFIEVGGTSSDCSAIVRGRPTLHSARIAGHRTQLQTLDVRTIGVAGGSVVRLRRGAVHDVGPRSAHIAGASYASFRVPADFEGAILPDPTQAVLLTPDGENIALTPTCAALALDEIDATDFAHGNREAALRAFAIVGEALGTEPMQLAHQILDRVAVRMRPVIFGLLADYELAKEQVVLIGGGGAAGVLVPACARRLGFRFRIARHAEVISPIGAALAFSSESVQRTLLDPSPEDILAVRREAVEKLRRQLHAEAGDSGDRINVAVEVDRRRNLVTAVASAAPPDHAENTLTIAEAAGKACTAIGVAASAIRHSLHEGPFVVIAFSGRRSKVAIVDLRYGIRTILSDAVSIRVDTEHLEGALGRIIDETTTYGDGGAEFPDLMMLVGASIVELGALGERERAIATAREEMKDEPPNASIILVAAGKKK